MADLVRQAMRDAKISVAVEAYNNANKRFIDVVVIQSDNPISKYFGAGLQKSLSIKKRFLLYQRRESNPHIRGYTILSRARLPVPPLWPLTNITPIHHCAPARRSVSRRRVYQFRHFGYLMLFSAAICSLSFFPEHLADHYQSV